MRQLNLPARGGVRIHQWGGGPPLIVPRGEVVAVDGPLGAVLRDLPEGAALAAIWPSAREVVAEGWAGGVSPDLNRWQRETAAMLRLARGGRIIPVSRAALRRAPEAMSAAVQARLAGAEAVARTLPFDAEDVLAGLALQAFPAVRAVERRLAAVGLGMAPPGDPADLLAGAGQILASLRDLEQQMLERRTQLAERDLAEAMVRKLAQDQLVATRAAAAAAYADLAARLGEGVLPPHPLRERDALAARLRAIEASTSWRLTAPLRRIADRLRRYRMKSAACM